MVELPRARTLFELLREQAGMRADKVAVIDRGISITFSEIEERARRLAAGLESIGINRGDRVGLLMDNCVEWLEVAFGAAALGAVTVPFSTWSTPRELAYLIEDSQVNVLIAHPNFIGREFQTLLEDTVGWRNTKTQRQDCGARFPALRTVVLAGKERHRGFLHLDELRFGMPLFVPLAPGDGASAADDVFTLYTSGSSNRPKAVRLLHYALIENGFNIGERQGLGPEDRVLLSPPLFWAYGSANALPAVLTHGAALVLQPRFEAGEALELIERNCCTAIYTLPGMTSAILEHSEFTKSRTGSLRTGLTIGAPQDVFVAAERLGSSEICNIYGASETYGNCCVTPHHWPLEQRAHCQGPPLPGVKIRIVDPESGNSVVPGEIGQVEVRGYVTPGYCCASSEHNAAAFTADGYFRTGDIGRLNESAAFVFVGRSTEIIKRAGINVSPSEVEEVLLKHADVAQAGVVGADDPERGEIIVAFVVPRQGCHLETEKLIAHCRSLLSKYKLPDRIELRKSLPFISTGKLARRSLKESAQKLVKPEEEKAIG